ncbi:MAG: ligand-binding sensor domain-containing protein [Bacteroidia bacterium]|jgi:ligand-binding sensor domain-containing protein
MRLASFLLPILITLLCQEAHGQELLRVDTANKQIIMIENIGIEQGLSQGMINAIAEDSTGYLWVATKDGLNR